LSTFEPNSEQGRSDLASMAEFLRAHPDTMARVIGYADDRGEANSNARLAEERAAATRSFLISQRIAQWHLVWRNSNRRAQILVQKLPTQAP